MTDLFWDWGSEPKLDKMIGEIVNENVIAAIKHFWEEDKPCCWLKNVDGGIGFKFVGAAKPTDEDPSGNSDVYSIDFSFKSIIDDFIDDWDEEDEQIERLEEIKRSINDVLDNKIKQIKGNK